MRWTISTLAVLVTSVVSAGRPAHAHSFDPALLALHERQRGTFDVIWKAPALPAGGDVSLNPVFPERCRRLADDPAAAAGDGFVSFWRVDCGALGLRGQNLAVSGIAGLHVDVVLRIVWRDGSETTGMIQGDESFTVPELIDGTHAGAPATSVLKSYVRLGVAHIWLGVDHLLFVLGLLLLIRSRRVLIQTITAFTVAHSLALALAVLGVVNIPPAPVEALIALSIVLVALELTRDPSSPPTLTVRYPWAVAFGFGLVHGLGFAAALGEIGLPPDQIPLALFSFNLGVEIGQIAFVVAMLAPLRLFERVQTKWAWARWLPAYAIGSVAAAWAIERVERFWLPLG
ncbi:MAG TPA: HupE/UreJ family protein [Candidatus Binatia bacterium]|nr:HupE/UreJ family protein [Candidatus Binatia bacterium]